MRQKQRTPDQWSVHVLNIHGDFFERWVEGVVRRAPRPWMARASQYAVEFPPPDGPVRGFESTLDVWAEYELGSTWVSLLIEAKKNDPEFIDWVFFRADPSDQAASNPGVYRLRLREDEAQPGVEVDLIAAPPTVPVTDGARETRGRWDAQNERRLTKTSAKAIGDAAHQAALATQAILTEQRGLVKDLLYYGHTDKLDPWRWRSFLPTVVTTGNLKVAEFDPTAVDPASGTIAYDAVHFSEVEWLWYLYPLPRHLQFATQESLELHRIGAVGFLTKLPLAIVRSTHLTQFLDTVTTLPQMPTMMGR